MLIGTPVIKLAEWTKSRQCGRLIWPGYACLVGLLSALYFGSLKDHLLTTDDHEAFQDNIAIEEDFTYFFSSQKAHSKGRPAAELIRFLAYLVLGNDPGAFHLFVVACHALVAILVARLALRLGLNLRASMVAGLFFLVNVAHFRAVHWIAAIEYPLALIWGLLAVLCYLRYLSTQKNQWLWGLYAGMFVGTLTLSAIVFLWPFCLYFAWLQRYNFRFICRALLPLLGLICIELVLVSYITPKTQHMWQVLDLFSKYDPLTVLFGMGRLLLWMAGLLLTAAHWLPVRLYEQQPWELWVGVTVLAGLALLLYRNSLPQAPSSVWILLSLLPFVPITDMIPLNFVVGPSRYLYPATVGSSLLLAWGIETVSLRLRTWGCHFYRGITVAIFISSYFSLKQAEALSFYLSGRTYIARENYDTGIEQLRRAIAQGPNSIDLYDAYVRLCILTLGTIEAEPILEEAISAFPDNPIFPIYKMVLDSIKADSPTQSQAQEKLDSFNKSGVIEIEGRGWLRGLTAKQVEGFRIDIAAAYNNMSSKFEKQGNLEGAILACRRSLEFSPRMKTYQVLTSQLLKAGLREEAALTAFEAVERNPQEASSWLHIVSSYFLLKLGRLNEAIAMCHKAMGKEPPPEQVQAVFNFYRQVLNGEFQGASSAAYTWMGLDFLQGGELDESIAAYRRALEEDRANSRALFNLGLAYLTNGNIEDAERSYAAAMWRFGRAGEERADAEEALRDLISRGIQVESARYMLETYLSRR